MPNQSPLYVATCIWMVSVAACGFSNLTGGGGDEESGTQYGISETYNETRNGAHLILSYDSQRESFIGTVENTTDGTLQQVRVEVHLSNGIELGPTTPVDLQPGERREVILTSTNTSFLRWSAHPEVGGSGESGGEHGEEGGEHR